MLKISSFFSGCLPVSFLARISLGSTSNLDLKSFAIPTSLPANCFLPLLFSALCIHRCCGSYSCDTHSISLFPSLFFTGVFSTTCTSDLFPCDSSLPNVPNLREEFLECRLCLSWWPPWRSRWWELEWASSSSRLIYVFATALMFSSFFCSPSTFLRYFSTLYLSYSLVFGTVLYIFFDRGLGRSPWVKAPLTRNSLCPGMLSVVRVNLS